jgi:hypothetical protein
MKITGNEPAYPINDDAGYPSYLTVVNGSEPKCTGLTIRQQFAMAAMQGILSNPATVQNIRSDMQMAEWSVQNADALIAELNRTEADNV